MAVMAEPAPSSGYPVRLDAEYPERLSRWLVLAKWLLAIPHLIIVSFLNSAYQLVSFLAFFAILFTARYPEGLFKFAVGIRRWAWNVNAYVFLLRDEYPPFSFDPGQYPAVLDIEYPQKLNRFLPLIKWLLAIPNLIVAAIVLFIALVLTFVAFFVILFTGKYPEGMFRFVVGAFRWSERVNAYVLFMTDKYPPFSTEP